MSRVGDNEQCDDPARPYGIGVGVKLERRDRIVPPLLALALNGATPEGVRSNALGVLSSLGEPAAVVLAGELTSTDQERRVLALSALAWMTSPPRSILAQVRALESDPDERIRREAAGLARRIKSGQPRIPDE